MVAPISIVITTYNRECYLGAAIKSVLSQTWEDFELLVWDDGSTDGSVEIARNYAKRDERVRFVAAEHQGIAPARKAAIAQTNGTYIGWVDSDDLLAPTALEETAVVLEANPDVGWVYTNYLDINESEQVIGYGKRCHIPYSKERLLLDFMTFHFRLIRRSVFDRVSGIDESSGLVDDYDLCLKLSEIAKVQHIKKPLYYYRNHQQNLTHQYQMQLAQDSARAIALALQRRGFADDCQVKLEILSLSPFESRIKLFFTKACSQLLATLSLAGVVVTSPVHAQSITPANDGTGTVVMPLGNRIDIKGGTLAGANLFHSFAQFSLNSGQTANFLSSPSIQNILGRVTGGNPSVINGVIQVSGGNSHLFLINPAGIIFGSHANLNVPASFTATTATGIGFINGWFNATGPNNYAALVSTPSTFAFTTPKPGAIVNAGNLAVGQGQNLTLLGGTIASTGTLSAPGGNITVAAVPGGNLVRIGQAGSVLSLEVLTPNSSQPNNWNLPVLSLPQLLTNGDGENATGMSVNSDGTVQLIGSGISVETGDVVARNVIAKQATLSAAHNLTLVESQLQTTGDLNLLAKDTVRVRDSEANPVIVQSGGNLTIQGNQGIDILALNHPGTPFQSGSNLNLISDGIISGDSHFISGGSFSILNLSGGNGTFVSKYDPTISSNQDVTFGDYTGVSLKVESRGSITGGNITITGSEPNPSAGDPDNTTLTTGNGALILRAGLTALQNPPSTFPTIGGFNSTGGPSSPGNINIKNIDIVGTTAVANHYGGPVSLTASGNIATGKIDSFADTPLPVDIAFPPVQGGDVTLNAGGSINTDAINSSASTNFSSTRTVGGVVNLQAGGSINTGAVNSSAAASPSFSSSGAATGGQVSLNAASSITTGAIDSSASSVTGRGYSAGTATGNVVNFAAGDDIKFDSITTTGMASGNNLPTGIGGNVSLIAAGVVRGVGGVATSASNTILTMGTTQAGSVTIQHDGGPDNYRFVVGDATNNGTAGAINTGNPISLLSPQKIIPEPATVPVIPANNTFTQGALKVGGIQITFVNSAPTLTANSQLTGAQQNQPFTFTYADLNPTVKDLNSDGTSDNTFVRVDTILAGKLTKQDGTVVGSGTLLSPGDVLIYTPASGAMGLINAFTIKADDRVSTSAPQQIAINVVASPPPPPIPIPIPSPTVLPSPPQAYPVAQLPAPPNAPPILIDPFVAEIDEPFTRQFDLYLGLANTPITTLDKAREILGGIEKATGVKPAVIYVAFVPPFVAPASSKLKKAEGRGQKAEGTNQKGNQIPVDLWTRHQKPTPESESIWEFSSQRAVQGLQGTFLKPALTQAQRLENLQAQESDELELLVVTPKERPIRKRISGVTRGQVIEVARKFRSLVTDVVRPHGYLVTAQQLYQWLLAPLEADLQGRKIQNLAFIMDTGLRSLPVAALHDGKEFLVEKYSVGLMPSLSLTDTRFVDIKKVKVLAMGADRFTNLNSLPAVPVELSTITQQLWPGKEFLNEGFTLDNLIEQRRQQPFGIVHLATHGEFNSGTPNNSFIQFWNSQLRLDQMRQLGFNDPPIELLVLSACKTALGNEQAELGFAGFAVQSGVKSAVASLWTVSDEGTLGLMTSFYEKLKTAPIKAEALRQAQVDMLQGKVRLEKGKLHTSTLDVTLPPELANSGNKYLKHPYYWSAFTMIGNPW